MCAPILEPLLSHAGRGMDVCVSLHVSYIEAQLLTKQCTLRECCEHHCRLKCWCLLDFIWRGIVEM